jgi:nucleotidyltransferase/DNA polymerase involved in DNA repair
MFPRSQPLAYYVRVSKVRYADFQTLTRDVTIEAPTADAETIRGAARACLRRVPLDRRLRLLGVRVSSLVRQGGDKDMTNPVSVSDDHAARKSLLLF